MLRKLFPTGVLALAFAAGICLAEPPTDNGGNEGGKDGAKAGQREGRPRRFGGEGRGVGARRRGEGGPMRFDPKAELARMTETLKLDETQQASIGKVLEDAQTKMTEQREKMRPSDEDRAKMDAAREEMRAAREAGDDAKVKELRDKMRESMGPRMEEARKAMDEIHKTMHDGIVAQLRDDQKPQFETMWAERMAMRRGGPDGPGAPNRGPLALKSIVDKLDDLTADQKQQIETLFTTFRDANKDKTARPSPEATKKLQADVMAVLTDGQKAKVEKALTGNRRGPGGPGGPGERPRRPRGDKPEEKHEGV